MLNGSGLFCILEDTHLFPLIKNKKKNHASDPQVLVDSFHICTIMFTHLIAECISHKQIKWLFQIKVLPLKQYSYEIEITNFLNYIFLLCFFVFFLINFPSPLLNLFIYYLLYALLLIYCNLLFAFLFSEW